MMERMGRGLAVVLMAVLMLTVPWLGAPGAHAATDQLDQSQLIQTILHTGGGDIAVYFNVRGSGSDVIGQTFTAGITGNLDRVSVDITTQNGAQHDVAVQIYAVDSTTHLPTGSPLNQTTIGDSRSLSTFTWEDVTLSSPVHVTSGTQYALALIDTGDTAGTATYGWAANVDNPYSGGMAAESVDSGATWLNDIDASDDATFKTWVIPDAVAPSFTSPSSTAFTVGTPGSFTVTASGVPTPALSETGALPGGVSFHDNGDGTATLSGTPKKTGLYPLTLTAASTAGTVPQSFTLLVIGSGFTCSKCSLPGVDLSHQTLSGDTFSGANLSGANLSGATAIKTNFSTATLTNAILSGANLTQANFSNANLTGAYLTDANLTGANLSNANLINANLTKANLTNANLSTAQGLTAQQLDGAFWSNTTCPDKTNSDKDGGSCLRHL